MRKPIPVSELLAQGKAKLERLKTGAEAANRALVALQQVLPPELVPAVWGATLDPEGVLTVVTDSGSWATRLRYALPALLPTLARNLGQEVGKTIVRVRPRPG
jgi:hypothetical protein